MHMGTYTEVVNSRCRMATGDSWPTKTEGMSMERGTLQVMFRCIVVILTGTVSSASPFRDSLGVVSVRTTPTVDGRLQ
jgi:hypothetical protein